MGDVSEARIERNNRIFREANEKIRASADRYAAELERIPFICECANPNCMKILRLTREQYGEVRNDERHYFTAVGHEAAEGVRARVVSHNDDHLIIEKPVQG